MNEQRCRWHHTREIVVVTRSVAGAACCVASRRITVTTTWIVVVVVVVAVVADSSSGNATWWDAAADSYVTRCGRQDSTGATRLCERADQSSREPRNELPRARAPLSLSLFPSCVPSLFRFPSNTPRSIPLSLPLFSASFCLRSVLPFARFAFTLSFVPLLVAPIRLAIPPLRSLLVSLSTVG